MQAVPVIRTRTIAGRSITSASGRGIPSMMPRISPWTNPHRPAWDLYLRLRRLADLRKLAAADQERVEAWVRDHANEIRR